MRLPVLRDTISTCQSPAIQYGCADRNLRMLDRIRQLFGRKPVSVPSDRGAVARWATARYLQYRGHEVLRFEVAGQLHERALRVECGPSTRSFITGLELRARLDLRLPPAGHVIVLSRSLLRTLEVQAESREDQRARAPSHGREEPEELRWLRLFQDTTWKGPGDGFWQRYAVLSDAPELARRWIDDEAQDFLLTGDSEAARQVPVMLALMRGKCLLRLQVNPLAQEVDALLALELLEYLGERALALANRSAESGRGPLSNPG